MPPVLRSHRKVNMSQPSGSNVDVPVDIPLSDPLLTPSAPLSLPVLPHSGPASDPAALDLNASNAFSLFGPSLPLSTPLAGSMPPPPPPFSTGMFVHALSQLPSGQSTYIPAMMPVQPSIPNFPPGFVPAAAMTSTHHDPQFKLSIPQPPVLEEQMKFVDWYPRIKQQAEAYGWGPIITSPGSRPDLWAKCKVWLTSFVPESDFQILYTATSWQDAMNQLREAHTTVDDVTALNLTNELFSQKLAQGEHPLALISRSRLIASRLETIGQPVQDKHLVSAVVKALKASPLWAPKVEAFLGTPGYALTLKNLQVSLSAIVGSGNGYKPIDPRVVPYGTTA